MSECSINLRTRGEPVPRTCSLCGLGPCWVWKTENPPAPEEPDIPDDGTRPEPGPVETRPDSAYAAALSETSILVEARAKAFDLAMKLAAQSDRSAEIQFPELISISNRVLAYLLEGK